MNQARNSEKIVSLNATVEDTIRLIIDHIHRSFLEPEIRIIAEYIANKYPDEFGKCQGASNFALRSAYYQPDPPDHQRVKSAYATLRDQRGNCVDYSILISAILLVLEQPHFLRLVELEPGKGFAHIYPVALLSDGRELALDIVPQQDQNGRERILRGLNSSARIGEEIEHSKKLDVQIK